MDIRSATQADIAGIAAARLSNGPAHDDSGADPGYCRHLIEDGQLMVAVEGDRVLGFAGAVPIGDARLLSDLYVHADAHGRGVGKALLAAVLEGAREHLTFATDDPAALPLYARAGMLSWWPLLSMRGQSVELDACGAVAYDLDIAHAVRFEERLTGTDRTATFRYWAGRGHSRTVGVDQGRSEHGGLVAVASIRTSERGVRIEHLAAPDADALEAVAAIVHLVSRDDVHVYVPGCRPLSAALMHAGFVIDGMQVYMGTSRDLVPDVLQVVHPGLG